MSQSSEEIQMVRIRDWRQALRSPPTYRIVNRTLRNQKHFMMVVTLVGLIVLLIVYIFPSSHLKHSSSGFTMEYHREYNKTYPLSAPIRTNSLRTFRIGIIADLDTDSKMGEKDHTWRSFLKKGYLSFSPLHKTVAVTWDSGPTIELRTNFAMKDRGMELSELVVFDGRLLTFDDRTGMVFEILGDAAVPWVLLMDGDGRTSSKGFKSEWATVKDQHLIVGSMGKEWTTAGGQFQHNNPQYLKVVNIYGEILHVNWIEQYKRIREVLDIHWPGYMIHESGTWSDVHQRWFFLPRRCSKEAYNETRDETMGCSVLISCTADVNDLRVVQLPNKFNTMGFSSFKFVPSTEDTVIVALRTEEINGKTSTFITSFDITGNIILQDTFVSNLKYEGLEFI